MNVWWCNQGHSWREERAEEVVRGSDRTSNATFRRTIAEVRAGDLIVHYHDSHVVAISRAKEHGRYSDALPEGYDSGWEFRTEYHDLTPGIHRDAFRHEITIPSGTGFAFNVKRDVNPGYFYRFSAEGLAVVLSHAPVTTRLPSWLPIGRSAEPPPVEERDVRMREGASFSWHLIRERNRDLADEAKRIHGHVCEVCGFDFARFYGPDGVGYIEAHHRVPFHALPEDVEVRLSPRKDFAVVCANCHRMLHRDPYPTVAELRRTVQQQRHH
jgi:hypothetical protein